MLYGDIYTFGDVDFAGLFVSKNRDNIISVKSRTGILLIFGTVPILWSSKLQTEIALSTLEAEYIALSQGMWELVSSHCLLLEIFNRTEYDLYNMSQVCKIWEDNYGNENIANSKGSLMTPKPNTLE